ncbi:hypothetical protein K466DRAFT_607084 [Polyporus arcularius HHB13444]|uniref:Ribonuclease H1 N-terminal domain-containing protein n=1 Tax=Polyporus arcularius HHB13444 TaxID=1314778 RepID=A0A5C3NXW6_9APHY|nr:hypothetical protein K466DRAFT_607084 [Polyporus arcularius HHB13444]
MSSDPSRELEQVEGSASSAPSFTFAEIYEMWLHIQEQYSAIHPEDPILDPCPHCMRRTLANAGHVHLAECEHGHSHGSGASVPDAADTSVSDAGDISGSDAVDTSGELWEQVSLESDFLAEHLPPILGPVPTARHGPAAGPSTSTPVSTRIVRDFASSAPPTRPPTPGGSVTRSIQVPDCAICPRHGPILTLCQTHGVTTVRRAPLGDPGNVAGPSRNVAGRHAHDDAGIADTVSVLNSFTGSLDDSLLFTPERMTAPLPTAGVAAPAIATPPPAIVNAAPVPAPVPAVVNAAPVPAPVPAAVYVAPVPAVIVPVAPAPAPAPAPAVVHAAPVAAPAPAVVNAAPVAAPAPAPAVAANPVLPPAPPAVPNGPPYTAYFTPQMTAEGGYYVVTRGRTVGVFDSWALMVASVSKISSGTGRGGFHSRDAAIAAFRDAEAAGIVVQRED